MDDPALDLILSQAKTKAELQEAVRSLMARNRQLENVIRRMTTPGAE